MTESRRDEPDPPSARGLIRLGSFLGVPVYLTPSWIFVALFVTLSYADFVRERANVSSAGAHLLALAFSLALALSVLAHELGHTTVSRRLDMQVRRIVVFLLGGVSEIDGESARPRDEILMAAAGPAVSFVLAGVFWAAAQPFPERSGAAVVLGLLAWSNLVIAIFNVLPGLPLDGGRIVQAVVWSVSGVRNRGTVVAAWSGRVVAVAVAVLIMVGNSLTATEGTIDVGAMIATALGFAVAAFMWIGASRTLHTAQIGQRAANLDIGHLIRPAIYLPPTTPIAEAVRQVALARAAGIVVVDADGRSRAIVREAQISGIEPTRRPWSTIADVARPLEPGLVLSDTLTGAELLSAVQANPASEYLVISGDGVSRGVIATVDFARALGVDPGAAR